MELTGSVLTGLFVGLVWVLIKVVEFFIKKYGGKRDNDISNERIKDLCDKVLLIKESCLLTKEQSDCLVEILKTSKKMEEMHEVFNENHVPAWYVPSELLSLVRESKTRLESLERDLDIAIDEIKDGHSIVVSRISDLITSQKLVTERLGDLISTLNNKLSH